MHRICAAGWSPWRPSGGGAGAFAAAVAAEAQRSGAQFALLFFSLSGFDPAELCRALTSEAPELAVVGCSTSGEMLPGGIASGHALAILLPARHFTVIAATIDNIAASGMDVIAEEVDRLKLALARRTAGHADHRRFAMCLIDGMSFAEERITAALHWALGDIPLIGGSAGDDLRFERTALISEGRVSNGSAVILLVSTALPFSIFKTDNFIPTEAKLVVTASDPDRRVVSRAQREARPPANMLRQSARTSRSSAKAASPPFRWWSRWAASSIAGRCAASMTTARWCLPAPSTMASS